MAIVVIYFAKTIFGFFLDWKDYRDDARADRANVEVGAATRTQDTTVQLWGEDRNFAEFELGSHYGGSCDTLFVTQPSYWSIALSDILCCKYVFNEKYWESLFKALKPAIFNNRHWQIGENHCYLIAMKHIIYAASQGHDNVGLDSIANTLDRKLTDKNGYARFRNMGNAIIPHVKDDGYGVSSVMNPTTKELNTIISAGGYAIIAVRSAWWFLHRVTVLGELNGKFIIADSSKRWFDEKDNCIKFVGYNKSHISKMLSMGTLELIPEEDLEKMILHSFAAEDIRARTLKNLSLNGIYGAWIYVYPINNLNHFEQEFETMLPLGLGRGIF